MATRRLVGLTALLAATVLGLAGCAAGTPTMHGRSGDASRGTTTWQGWPVRVMGGAPNGYHFRTPSCSPPDTLPGTPVAIVVGDMGMMRVMGGVAPYGSRMLLRAMPSRVPVGQVTFVVANVGWRKHEFVVLPLPPGRAVGERVVDAHGRISESGSLGEASATCAAGEGDGIRSGAVGWVTLTLPAGNYELVCNLPNHYSSGMRQQFTVR